MKKVWARIGISLDVSDEKYIEFESRFDGGFVDLTEEEAQEFVDKGTVDGDSYIPESGLETY